MIDFKAELDKILKEDPLELLKISTNKPITPDQRLIDSFREIFSAMLCEIGSMLLFLR